MALQRVSPHSSPWKSTAMLHGANLQDVRVSDPDFATPRIPEHKTKTRNNSTKCPTPSALSTPRAKNLAGECRPGHSKTRKLTVTSDFAPAAAVIVPASAKILYISGVVGDSADGTFGDFRTQVFLMFEVSFDWGTGTDYAENRKHSSQCQPWL